MYKIFIINYVLLCFKFRKCKIFVIKANYKRIMTIEHYTNKLNHKCDVKILLHDQITKFTF